MQSEQSLCGAVPRSAMRRALQAHDSSARTYTCRQRRCAAPREGFTQKLELLRPKLQGHGRNTRHVAARAREAPGQAQLYRGAGHSNDRDNAARRVIARAAWLPSASTRLAPSRAIACADGASCSLPCAKWKSSVTSRPPRSRARATETGMPRTRGERIATRAILRGGCCASTSTATTSRSPATRPTNARRSINRSPSSNKL